MAQPRRVAEIAASRMFAQNAGGVRRGVRSSAALPAPTAGVVPHFQEDSGSSGVGQGDSVQRTTAEWG